MGGAWGTSVPAPPASWAAPRREPMNCAITPNPPLRDTVPLLGRRSPAMIRSSVVLPAPLGPTRATTAPSPTRNETSSSSTRPSGRW